MKFTIPVTWTVSANIEINASNLENALEEVNNVGLPEDVLIVEAKADTNNIDCSID